VDATSIVEVDPQVFAAYFNRKPFHIRHSLCGHPLFELPRLLQLARVLPERFVEYNGGTLPVGVRPEDTPRTGLSAEETVRRIQECGSWMVLKRVEQDPEYGALLDRCLDGIAAHAPGLVPPMQQREGFIFLSSPGAVTPFHMDPEHNFLLQIRGSKTVSMWDPDDRFVLPEEELERFYTRFVHRNLPWRDVFQTTAYVLPLAAGEGLHFPVTVPHWVKNGPEVSVSFSITFRTTGSARRELVYRANARLRKLGFSPTPVGQSILLDRTKQVAFGAAATLKRMLAPAASTRPQVTTSSEPTP
jgi:cupin-like protein